LLSDDLEKITIDGREENEVLMVLNKGIEKLSQPLKGKIGFALVISGDALMHAMKPGLSKMVRFYIICSH